MNFFYFSDYIKPIAEKIKLASIVFGRFFKILFRKRKNIKLLQLDYTRKYQFDNSYLIIQYRFKNVLWYNFKNIKKTTEKEVIILNLKKIPEMPIELIVHGFFRKKVFQISVVPKHKIESKRFKTAIHGLNAIEIEPKSIMLNNKNIIPTFPKIKMPNPKYKITFSKPQIKHSFFNQTDFI